MQLVEGQPLDRVIPEGGLPAAGPRDRQRTRRGARRGPREGHRPPRPQARQRHGDGRRAGEGPGLRPRPDEPAGEPADSAMPTEAADARGRRDGDGALHVARAGFGASRSTRGPTSSRSASCSTRWRAGGGRSREPPRPSSPPRSCATRPRPSRNLARRPARGVGAGRRPLPREGPGRSLPGHGGRSRCADVRAAEGLTVSPTGRRPGRRRHALPIAGAVLVLLAGAAYLGTRLRAHCASRTRAGGDAVAPGAIRSIAVLPLDNYSGDASQDYFAEGMTDELTTQLAMISQLRVISRGSAMQFKGAGRPRHRRSRGRSTSTPSWKVRSCVPARG